MFCRPQASSVYWGEYRQTRSHVGVVARAWYFAASSPPRHQHISFTTMSLTPNGTRPSWASKTAFDSLGVESGEESEEEVLELSTVPDRYGPCNLWEYWRD